MIAPKAFTMSPVDSDGPFSVEAELRFADGDGNILEVIVEHGCGCCGIAMWHAEGRAALRAILIAAGLEEFPWPTGDGS